MTSTIREILVEAQQRFGPEVAVRYKVGKNQIEDKTYNQLRQDSESFSSALAALGEQGSHIAVIGPTSYRWMVTYLGIVNSGSVAVPLDASLPAADVWELLDRADVTTLVADAARKDVAEGAKEHCPKLKHVVLMQQEEHSDAALSLPQLLAEHQTAFDFEPQPDQLCTIMFTSGTTGKSKGVMLTHRNLAENAGSINMDLPERMVLLSVLPIHHAYYKMPEETAATLEDGWLKTGDLGYVDEEGFVYLTGRKKNLIITKNGENVSPEELENKLGVERLIQEVLVRENKSVIEAEIFPDYEYAKKKHIKDVRATLQEIIDQYNLQAPPHKKIYSLIVRETEFEKTPSKKIKRF